jgi:hypothetical protein
MACSQHLRELNVNGSVPEAAVDCLSEKQSAKSLMIKGVVRVATEEPLVDGLQVKHLPNVLGGKDMFYGSLL